MAYNSGSRSERLLQGRRFTTDGLNLTQEAFTDVFDLGANEIFTDDGLIPTGSSQLLYSGSSQDGLIVSASTVNPTTYTEGSTDDLAIVKFYHRKKLKGAADATREIYYFTTSDPSSHDDYVTSDQIIEADQQTNFVSPKYIIPGHASRNAESITPGYKVAISYGNDENNVTAATDDQFVFDYKTGVLTWVGTPPHDGNDFVFITAYQYVGRTLRTQIDDGTLGGSGFPFSGSAVITGSLTVSSSKVDFTNATAISGSTFSGSFVGDGSGLSGLSADSVAFDNITSKPALISGSTFSSPSQGTLRATINGVDNDIDLGLQTGDNVEFTNLTLSGDLTVQGTTTTVDSTTVNISSSIVRVNYGGAVAEGGIEVTDATGGNIVTGSLLWDGTNDYWKGGPKGSEVKLLRETGDSILSGSAQIATDISGAFTAASASFSTRVTLNDAKVSYTDAAVTSVINTAGVISGSAQIATDISGAFTAASASFSTRVTANDAKVGYTDGAVTSVINTAGVLSGSEQIATEISGAFTAASASFSTRVTLNDAKVGYTDGAVTTVINTAGVLSGSEQIATEISGAFTAASASFSTRVTANDAKVSYTDAAVTSVINTAGVISGSAQIATEISGAFTAASGGFSTRVTANESAISSLQGNEVHTAAAISGAIDAATGSLFSGTPTDDQIAIFTDHNTIEGSSNLTFNGTLLTAATASITQNLTVGGDLTVNGTTTTVNSTTVEIGDNIIVLNSAEASDNAGIYVFDADSAGVTGSLLYDYDSNYWIAGTKDSEKRIVTFTAADPTNDSFIHLNGSDEVVAISSGSTVGAFLQKTAAGFEVSAVIDGGTY